MALDSDGDVERLTAEQAEAESRAAEAEDLEAGHEILTLVNDLLDMSKIETGDDEVYYEEVDLGELLDDVAHSVSEHKGAASIARIAPERSEVHPRWPRTCRDQRSGQPPRCADVDRRTR